MKKSIDGVTKMGQFVQTFNTNTIKKMKEHYSDYITTTLPPGAVFRAKTNHAVITAYKSGKVLFQGANPSAEESKWTSESVKESTSSKPARKQAKQTNYSPDDSLFTSTHIGSDESGTGDYFGPVTTCAAYITNDQIAELKSLGIQDSKAITDDNIHLLSKEIVKLKIPYSLLILHNEKYNSLQKQGWSQGKMKAMLHHNAIKNVVKKIDGEPYDGILIDQFCNPPVYINYLKSEGETLLDKTFFMTKAESYSIAVATASVIARESFLQEMQSLSEKIGYTLLKGASHRVDQLIAKIMREQGENRLQMCAKLHFANTEKGRKLV